IKQLRPQMTSRQLVRAGQVSTLVLVVLASAWVPFIERVSDSLWGYLQLVIAFTSPPVVSAFLLGLFWKRANGTGAFVSLLAGGACAVFMILSQTYDIVPYLNEMHFLAKANLLFVVSILVHVLASLASSPPAPQKVEEYTYRKKLFAQETEELRGSAWYRNYRILAIILLAITALVVGVFL
ncbi:MAG: sodium transporter, partial [Arenibacter sp.]|nr:sodium transporter [Arenibacter sp.]